ncbi:hypothetical protein OESDEN_01483 [Oesophagostomum dentatum]|uniref:Uncharacterized protein n=1 Tax=Oesophagostomum dentatum TaxID=61180 RepID=A0A0B1TLV8_OESDE|nr:hypothetical protein OESDEN_01483 [Oesophagostomum dentatum]
MAVFRSFALRRLEEELRDFTLADFFEKLKMEDQAFEGWLRSIGLLATPRCRSCQHLMRLDNNINVWICHRRGCRFGPTGNSKPTVNIRKDSFFSKAKIPLSEIFAMSYFWLHNIGLVGDKDYELGVGHTSVTQCHTETSTMTILVIVTMAAFQIFALRRLEEELRDFTLSDIFEKLKVEDQAFEGWLRSIGLLATPRCRSCQHLMRLDNNINVWICHRRECRFGPTGNSKPTINIRKDSFFSKAKIPLSEIFAMSYFWLHNIGLVGDKDYELGVGHTSVMQWEKYFRAFVTSISEETGLSLVALGRTKPASPSESMIAGAGFEDISGTSEATKGGVANRSWFWCDVAMPGRSCG